MMTLKNCVHSRECSKCDNQFLSVFSDLPSEGLQALEKAKSYKNYKKGEYIFHAGEDVQGVYCVQAGTVKLEAESEEGHSHILRVTRPGGLLGYRSLFADSPYQAHAKAQEETSVCFIPKKELLGILKQYPEVSIKILSVLSKDLRNSEDRFCSMTDKDAEERVAESLLFLTKKFPDQKWTRKDIADWAGTTPETVMRTLSKFQSEGLIRQEGRKIHILLEEDLLERARISEF